MSTRIEELYPCWGKIPVRMTVEEWRQEWNIPNWNDPASYPKKLTNDQWKWEFVRRKPEYRSLWNSFEESRKELTGRKVTLRDFDTLDDEMRFAAMEYELDHFYNPRRPATDFPKKFFYRAIRGKELSKLYGPNHNIILTPDKLMSLVDDDRYRLFILDTRFPIKPQKTAIANTLGMPIKRDRKPPTPEKLLRLIDAFSEKVTNSEAAQVIFGSEADASARARDELITALELWQKL